MDRVKHLQPLTIDYYQPGTGWIVTLEGFNGAWIGFPLGQAKRLGKTKDLKTPAENRKAGAIMLASAVSATAPFTVRFSVLPDGTLNWRGTEQRAGNPYQVFDPVLDKEDYPGFEPTEAQRLRIAAMTVRKETRPFHAGGGPSVPVKRWAGVTTGYVEEHVALPDNFMGWNG